MFSIRVEGGHYLLNPVVCDTGASGDIKVNQVRAALRNSADRFVPDAQKISERQ